MPVYEINSAPTFIVPVDGKFVVDARVIEVPDPPVPAVSSNSGLHSTSLNTCWPPPQSPVPQPNPNVEPKAPGLHIYSVTVADPDPLTVVPAALAMVIVNSSSRNSNNLKRVCFKIRCNIPCSRWRCNRTK